MVTSACAPFAAAPPAMTPAEIFHREVASIHDRYAGLLDGDHDSIHRARIATRRVREILPLTHDWQHQDRAEDLRETFKRMGRALGRVRDADTRVALLRYLEARIPHAAPSLVLVRQAEEHHRLTIMRKLIKRFERLAVERELAQQRHAIARWRAARWPWTTTRWRDVLRAHVADRARGTCEAVAYATGIYFPNRVHSARIEIKKFRYAAEIAVETSLLDGAAVLRVLKKSQDLLGDLHDRQTLLDDLRQTAAHDARIDATHLCLVAQVVEADIADLHARYLQRRDAIRTACSEIPAAMQRPNRVGQIATVAGAVAVVTGLEARRRRRVRALDSAEANDAAVRIVVPLRERVPS